ncbi:hypothetical protein NE237_032959 [Protea cynaroides]|uniref:Uncharacterized protein n=1 Tax=Protea cynaroides TaxID=273540 RepID=A0A9Q0R3Z6_9MAGN|nr:hypothetical protein NE237_032959 [Protea cynaroides]
MAEEFQESDVFWPEQSHQREDQLYHSFFQDENVDPAQMVINRSSSHSLPINIPCNNLHYSNSKENDEHLGEDAEMVPPHLIIADRIARQMAFSVCKGNERTLKGRNLKRKLLLLRVRVLIWRNGGEDEGISGGNAGELLPLGCELGKDEEGILRVICEEVVEAVADDVGIAELGEDESSSLLQEIVPYTGVLNLKGFRHPLLAVQLCLPSSSHVILLVGPLPEWKCWFQIQSWEILELVTLKDTSTTPLMEFICDC